MFGFLNQNLGCHLNPSLPGEMMALIFPPYTLLFPNQRVRTQKKVVKPVQMGLKPTLQPSLLV